MARTTGVPAGSAASIVAVGTPAAIDNTRPTPTGAERRGRFGHVRGLHRDDRAVGCDGRVARRARRDTALSSSARRSATGSDTAISVGVAPLGAQQAGEQRLAHLAAADDDELHGAHNYGR